MKNLLKHELFSMWVAVSTGSILYGFASHDWKQVGDCVYFTAWAFFYVYWRWGKLIK
jgi:hypothetical protein